MKSRILFRVDVENFGPFEKASVEVKPLTILIGKNSMGKSMLLYLLWCLTRASPDFLLWARLTSKREGVKEAMDRGFEKLKGAEAPVEEMHKLIEAHLDTFPEAWSKGLAELLKQTFGVESLRDLARGGSPIRILLRGNRGFLELGFDEEARGEWLHWAREILKEVEVRSGASFYLELQHGKGVHGTYVRDETFLPVEAVNFISCLLPELLGPVASNPMLFVDGRAGITRTLLSSYPSVASQISKETLSADRAFMETVYRLAKLHEEGQVDLGVEPARLLLEELGIKLLRVEREHGFQRRFYVETWTGCEHPVERAPSGIREVFALVCALASKEPELLFVEEPEVHLHPRAVRCLARLIAYSLNAREKSIILTTHSNLLIYQLNNLIALSSKPEKAEKLGIAKQELLQPGDVAAYLVRSEEGRGVVQRLELDETGFDESTLADVVEEIADERSEVFI